MWTWKQGRWQKNSVQRKSSHKKLSDGYLRGCSGAALHHSMSVSSTTSSASTSSGICSPGDRIESDSGEQSSFDYSEDQDGSYDDTDYRVPPQPVLSTWHEDMHPLAIELNSQARSGGLLAITASKELKTVPPQGAENYQLQEITKIVFKEEDGGGLCVTFRSKEFSCFIIGYPDDGYVVKGNGNTEDDKRTWWRLRSYAKVFTHSLPKYGDSVLLQLWDEKHSFDPDNERSLYFIIDSNLHSREYKLGTLTYARTMGAFKIDSISPYSNTH